MDRKIIIAAAILIVVVVFFLNRTSKSEPTKDTTPQETAIPTQNDPPQIVSTKPDPLEDTIVSASEPVEITFNRSIENVGEFKLKIEPKIDFKITLSSDRKTAQISFPKPLELGMTYTLFIGTDTKFDGVGAWGKEKIYHIKTVSYRGV